MNHAPDNSIWRKYSRIRPQTMRRTLIDRDGLASRRVASNDPCDNGFFKSGRLKTHEGANALRLKNRFSLLNHLETKLIVLTYKTLILIVDTDQCDVTVPTAA